MNRIYIVTGAAGFLGSTICRQLVNDNQRVRALVLPNDKAAKYLPKEVDIYEGDICNKDSLKDIFNVEEFDVSKLYICTAHDGMEKNQEFVYLGLKE
jgi:dihydroflavonol-4-reductase